MMKKHEAMTLLETAPAEDSILYAINSCITQKQAVSIVYAALLKMPEGDVPGWMEKRVKQMANPVYK